MNTLPLLYATPPIERTAQNIRIINILLQNSLAVTNRPRAFVTGNYSGLVIFWGTIAETDSHSLRELKNLGSKSCEVLMAWLEIVKREHPELLELHAPEKMELFQLPECPICRRFHEHGHIEQPSLDGATITIHGKTYRLVLEAS